MGVVLDMIGQGEDTMSKKKVGKEATEEKKLGKQKPKAEEIAPDANSSIDKEGEFAVRKSKSEKFRMSMRRQPVHKGKFSMGGSRIKKAR